MEVKVQSVHVEQDTKWGKVKKQHGLSRVLVDGKLAGYVPINGQPASNVFHPLPAFPRELDAAVVKEGGFKRSLRDKKAKNEQPMGPPESPAAEA